MITKIVPLRYLTTIRQKGSVEVGFINNINDTEGVDFVVGNGSNLLVKNRKKLYKLSDDFKYIRMKGEVLNIGAATKIREILSFCLDHSISCVDFLAGVPATIGGAVFMNAGAFGGDMRSIVKRVKVVENGKLKSVDTSGFSYRSSGIKGIIVEVDLYFKNIDYSVLRRKLSSFVKRRIRSAHIKNTFGSVFKNPKENSAGWFIEKVGLKGYSFGSVRISPKHANYIVSDGNADVDDVLFLIDKAKIEVFKAFGVELEEEVVIV